MRSAPSQPGNYLGDDPDLAAELGQRLAATAQTGQGVITNYLFYGQRRAAEQHMTDQRRRDDETRDERHAETLGAGEGPDVGQAAQRTRDDLDRAPVSSPTDSTVSEGQAETARRTFHVVDPHDAVTRTGGVVPGADPGDQQPAIEDPLMVDGLADDPRQRDPLAHPGAAAVPQRVTLGAQGPARAH